MGVFEVRSVVEIAALEDRVRAAANLVPATVADHKGVGVALLRRMKFEALGHWPLGADRLNVAEQIDRAYHSAIHHAWRAQTASICPLPYATVRSHTPPQVVEAARSTVRVHCAERSADPCSPRQRVVRHPKEPSGV
jgi:hypothetical protein